MQSEPLWPPWELLQYGHGGKLLDGRKVIKKAMPQLAKHIQKNSKEYLLN